MNIKKIIHISLATLLIAGIAAYTAYATMFMSKTDPTEGCTAMELTVDTQNGIQYVDSADIAELLKTKNIFPVGKLMNDVSTNDIEKAVAQNTFVEKVECFKSGKGKVCIKVKQRRPVIYILPDGKDGYFVDANGKVIKNTHYAANIVTATGKIDEAFATNQLAQFGTYLQEDKFWNSQIEQIYVTNGNKAPQIELIPRVGDHVINMGSIDDYEKKLKRLKVFYKKAMDTVGWNKYSHISIEYDRLVVCTKREHKKKQD